MVAVKYLKCLENEQQLNPKIPDIGYVSCHMTLSPSIKLLVVPLAGRLQALDFAPQLPPVAVHVLLGNNIINGQW